MVWFPKTEPQPISDTPQVRAVHALEQARKNRHWKNCRCRMFQKSYCSAGDALWSRALDRILDEIRK